jgi:hypothetical protein
MSNVEKIKKLEAEADKLSAEYESNRWEAARLISEELASGMSQRELARQIGKSDTHVIRMRKCWEAKCNPRVADNRTFNEVYHSTEVRGEPKPKPEPEPEKRPEPEERRRQRPEPDDDWEEEKGKRKEEQEEKEKNQTANGWALKITASVDMLHQYNTLWGDLSDGSLERLEESITKIETIIEGAKKCVRMSEKRSTTSRAKAV